MYYQNPSISNLAANSPLSPIHALYTCDYYANDDIAGHYIDSATYCTKRNTTHSAPDVVSDSTIIAPPTLQPTPLTLRLTSPPITPPTTPSVAPPTPPQTSPPKHCTAVVSAYFPPMAPPTTPPVVVSPISTPNAHPSEPPVAPSTTNSILVG